MPQYYEYELAKAAHKLVSEMLKLKPGEIIAVTADTESDPRVVDATAAAAFAVGAKPMVIWNPSSLGVGKAADPMLPGEALVGALSKVDAWVEYNNQWIFYSKAYDDMIKKNRVRCICLTGMNVASIVRTIGKVNVPLVIKLGDKLVELTQAADKVHIKNAAGTDIVGYNRGRRVSQPGGIAEKPGPYMLCGQVGWNPVEETINGVVAIDGWE